MVEKVTPNYIVVEETDSYLKVVIPPNYDPLAVEELIFFTDKEVFVEPIDGEEFTKLLQEKLTETTETEEEEKEEEPLKVNDILLDVSDSPTVRLVNRILIKAANVGASDIHFEPYEDETVVRLRMDGELHNYTTYPLQSIRRWFPA